jgi:MFS family permease
MGYSKGMANLLAAPPFIASVPIAFVFAWIGDKYHTRGPIIAIQAIIVVVGLMMTGYHSRHGIRYLGMFFGYAGCQGNIPAILAYQSNNIRFQSKRAVGSALQIGFGAIGGIIASTTFRQKDAPKYLVGIWVTAGLQFFILLILSFTTFYFSRQNRKADRGELSEIEGQPDFRYTL